MNMCHGDMFTYLRKRIHRLMDDITGDSAVGTCTAQTDPSAWASTSCARVARLSSALYIVNVSDVPLLHMSAVWHTDVYVFQVIKFSCPKLFLNFLIQLKQYIQMWSPCAENT